MKIRFFRLALCTVLLCLVNLTAALAAPPKSAAHYCGFTGHQYHKRGTHPDARSKTLALNVGTTRTVRIIYFLPNDRPYREQVVKRIKEQLSIAQSFFADQMQAHGYGRQTFRVETDAYGEPIVNQVGGRYPDSHYPQGFGSTPVVIGEIEETFNLFENVYLVFIDRPGTLETAYIDGGQGRAYSKRGGFAFCLRAFDWWLIAHELGHAFGLYHDFRDGAYVMSYGPSSRDEKRLSQCHAVYLSVHTYFNQSTPIEAGEPPTIELISPRSYSAFASNIIVSPRLHDFDGLHQVILHVNQPDSPNGSSVKACFGLGGNQEETAAFDYDGVIPHAHSLPYSRNTNLFNPTTHPITIEAIDTDGNVSWRDFTLFSEKLEPLTKVSGDNQHGLPDTPLLVPFVVEVRDVHNGNPIEGVAVRFSVAVGGGRLSVESAHADRGGRAASVLTLGANIGQNTVEVSAAGIGQTVTFNAMAGLPIHIPDPNLRAAVENALNKKAGEPIAPAEMAALDDILDAANANISNLTGLEAATNLRRLNLWENNISDIKAVSWLTDLTILDLSRNNISDISPLVANTGLGNGDEVHLQGNPLSYASIYLHIPALQERRVEVGFDSRPPPRIRIQSGSDQRAYAGEALENPFVVAVLDEKHVSIEGVPIVFTVTVGGGTLSATSAMTDSGGQAETTLTLGQNPGKNSVEASAVGLLEKVTFHAVAETQPPPIIADANGDGNVDRLDIVYVAVHYGRTGKESADVNGDGVVNIDDVIAVAAAVDSVPAAPAARVQLPTDLSPVMVEHWLTEAKLTGKNTPQYRRGVLTLKHLLAALTPNETALLPNYPNPFNPETWIPYHLSRAGKVTLTIYDVQGNLVRQLDLGHRDAGFYANQTQAAHWDGRNQSGETVPSGVYFYQMRSGDYESLRRMAIVK